MPSALHEEFFDHLKDCFTLAISTLPYDLDTITARASMNSSMRLKRKSVTPDMVISITPVWGPRKHVVTAALGECALSETKEEVFDKMEEEIEAHPEVDFVVIIVVNEATAYACPAKNSIAWEALRNGKDNPSALPLASFLELQTSPRMIGQPLTVAGHNWCHIQSVEYFVWTKGDDGSPIDVRNVNPGYMAYGVCCALARSNSFDGICFRLCCLVPSTWTPSLQSSKSGCARSGIVSPPYH